jgi:hypothetical protein
MTKRSWMLKRLDIIPSNVKQKNSQNIDLEEFKCDLEDDVVLRKEVNLYKNAEYVFLIAYNQTYQFF